jgi:23S rRNA pseudouridine2457 synthase
MKIVLHNCEAGYLSGSPIMNIIPRPPAKDIIQPSHFPSPRPFPPYIESTWLSITITEGKFRQVRKMVAAIRHRCMRLLRTSIEDMELGNLQPGAIKEVDESTFFSQLKLKAPGEIKL